MDIVGQFNLGLIVARRKHAPVAVGLIGLADAVMDDLFVVDRGGREAQL